MKPFNFRLCFGLGLAGLALALGLESFSGWDLIIQKHFYDFTAQSWLIGPADHRRLRLWFYDGPKIALILSGLAALAVFLGSLKRPGWRKKRGPALTLWLSLALVPLLVAGAKQFTNVYCPRELTVFNGRAAYQRALEPAAQANENRPRGRCFPAGHATGGFAWLALYFCGSTPARRRRGLAAGLAAGGLMGGYQMLRGEHFLSHTLTSLAASWLVITAVARLSALIFPPD